MSVLDGVDLHLVESPEECQEFLRWLGERRPILAIDIETSGLSLTRDVIRMVQFGDGREGWAIPYEEWRGLIRYALQEYEGARVLHHAKFDAGMLLRDGLPFPWERVHDTAIMCFLADSMGPKSLKPAAALYVDPVARQGEAALKKAFATHRWNYGTIPVDAPVYWGYAAADTVLTALLAEKLWPRIQYARGAYDLELACERVLCDMEMRGVPIDVEYVNATKAEIRAELDSVLADLDPVNPSAPASILEGLADAGFKLTKRTEGGSLATDDSVLSAIDHPIAHGVRRARWFSKLLGSYFDRLLEFEKDGRIQPHINQLQARTGRMSMTDPAIQTLPKKAIIRDAFIPTPGNLLILADYDSQELRVAAEISGDPRLIAAFAEDRDPHMETARLVYGDGAGRAERGKGKQTMYATVYGAEAETIAASLRVDVAEAARIRAALFQLYPGLERMMADIVKAVRKRASGNGRGYVVLPDKRRLSVPIEKAYAGVDYRIQGQCASELKQSIVSLDAAGLGPYLHSPHHDEIVFDVPEAEVEDTIPVIRECMERPDYRVPLTIDTKVVDRWGTAYREDS